MEPTDAKKVGDIVIYRAGGVPVHVAIVMELKVTPGAGLWVLSQWGADGEYLHDADDYPAFLAGSEPIDLEVWTERVES